MNLIVALPALNRIADHALPPLNLPALNRLLQFGEFCSKPMHTSAFFAQYFWQGSLLALAKKQLQLGHQQAVVFASPVWQQMGMNYVNIINSSEIDLSWQEAKRFCNDLNGFYRSEQWLFMPLRTDLWLVCVPQTPDWQVPPVFDVWGANDGSLRARGADRQLWLQKQTEIQMWLHQHSLNQQRLAAGLVPINGVWLWQDLIGRQHGQQHGQPFLFTDSVWSSFYEGMKRPLPEDFSALMDLWQVHSANHCQCLLLIDDLLMSQYQGDVAAYIEKLLHFEERWFAPIWQALKQAKLSSFQLMTDGIAGGSLLVKAKAGRAFWKKKRLFTGVLSP